MENQQDNLEQTTPQKNILFRVTPFSRIFTGVLLIMLPFLGLWVGMQYPSSVVEAVPVNIVRAPETKTDTSETLPGANVDEETAIRELSKKVLMSFRDNDINTFKTLVHPTEGLIFSYDGHVDPDDVKMTITEIEEHLQKNDEILWGLGDGSGLPIKNTLADRFKMYSKIDYLSAPQNAYNKVLTSGNTNIDTVYAGKPFLSFYLPPTDTYTDENGKEVIQPNSWKAINLVFDMYNNKPFLIGVVTDNWTI